MTRAARTYYPPEPRPKRRRIPMRIRREVVRRQRGLCKCGCGEPVFAEEGKGTHLDHEPALRLRALNRKKNDYKPHQHSPDHIDAYAHISHAKKKTSGHGTVAGSDIGKIVKERKRAKKALSTQTWTPATLRDGDVMVKDGVTYRAVLPSRKIPSHPFPPRGSRPMRRKA